MYFTLLHVYIWFLFRFMAQLTYVTIQEKSSVMKKINDFMIIKDHKYLKQRTQAIYRISNCLLAYSLFIEFLLKVLVIC